MLLALKRITEQKYGSGEGKARGCRVIAVAGATGGVGCTSLAVNIGCNLAQRPENSVASGRLDLPLRCRRILGHDPRLQPGRRDSKRLAIGLSTPPKIAHQTLLRFVPASTSGTTPRCDDDQPRELATRFRIAAGFLHAYCSRYLKGVHRSRFDRHGNWQ